jgi:hypothetical protein
VGSFSTSEASDGSDDEPHKPLSSWRDIMRSYILAVPMSLLLAAPFAHAQQQDYPRTDGTTQTVQVPAPPGGIVVTADQAESIRGTYELSNGWHLKAQPMAATHGMIARIDGQPEIRLIALPGNKFVSADGNVAMEFGRGDFHDEMMMSYLPSSSAASDSAARVTLVSR